MYVVPKKYFFKMFASELLEILPRYYYMHDIRCSSFIYSSASKRNDGYPCAILNENVK